jgi:hypothetical protein
MKRFIVIAVAVAFVFPSIPVFAQGPETITLPAKMMGNVTFPHKMHQETLKGRDPPTAKTVTRSNAAQKETGRVL